MTPQLTQLKHQIDILTKDIGKLLKFQESDSESEYLSVSSSESESEYEEPVKVLVSTPATPEQQEKHECDGDGYTNDHCYKKVKFKFSDGTYYCKKHHQMWLDYYNSGYESDSESE